jgi:hypothetical protein
VADRELDVRRGPLALLLIGAGLLASLNIGVVLTVTHLYAEHRGVAGAIDPRLVDAGALPANGALLFAFLRLSRFDRESIKGPEGDA